MQAILDVIASIGETLFSLGNFLMTFLGETVQMLLTLVKLPAILGTVLQWTNTVGVLPYITCIIGLAIVYKILGRE